MRSLPDGWKITRHAADKMVQRGISPAEIADLIEAPQLRTPDPRGNPDIEQWWRGEVGAAVNPSQGAIVTVLLNGASRHDWQQHAESRHDRRARARETARTAMAKVAAACSPAPAARPARRRTAVPRGVHPDIYKLALKQAKGDPGRLKILGPTRIEVAA